MDELITGLVLTLLGGLALVVIVVIALGPEEVIAVGETILNAGEQTAQAIGP